MQRAQPDDRSRHAGLRPEPLTRNREGETQPPVYSRTNAICKGLLRLPTESG
jgi:hypothetical protein